MSITEDPQYPWALHRLVLINEKQGNYQIALDSAYETQDLRLYAQDEEANQAFNQTIERLEGLIEKYGDTNEEMRPKDDDTHQQAFDDTFNRIHQLITDFNLE